MAFSSRDQELLKDKGCISFNFVLPVPGVVLNIKMLKDQQSNFLSIIKSSKYFISILTEGKSL